MTEEEAKTKRCPMAMSSVGEGETNRVWFSTPEKMAGSGACNCIGSECMLWRRALPLEEKNTQHHNPHSQPEGDGWEWRNGPEFGWFRRIADNGYCGLAGKL